MPLFDGDGATNFTFSTSPAGLNGALISSHLHTLSTTRLCACACGGRVFECLLYFKLFA